jgi:hypothetical protein
MSQFYIISNVVVKSHVTNNTNCVIPSSVTSIADGNSSVYVFDEFKSKTFTLSFGVNSKITRIGQYALAYCSNLTSVDFSNANLLDSIGNFAFYKCTSLQSIEFPASLTSLDIYGSFCGCNKLSYVKFPTNTKISYIGNGAFESTNLTTFNVPATCVYLVGSTFSGTKIEYFTVEGGNKHFKEYNGSIFNYHLTALISHRRSGELSLPLTTNAICDLAFSAFSGNIRLEKNITSISSWAFLGYSGKFIEILGTMSNIRSRNFERCSNLIEVKFYCEVNTIDSYAFKYCHTLKRVFFLYKPENISEEAFPDFNKICFYGDVDGLEALLPTKRIKKCGTFFNCVCTCSNKNTFSYYYSYIMIFLLLSE